MLLTLSLSSGAEQATTVVVSVSLDGAMAQQQSASRSPGKTSDTIEIDFAAGYPAGHTLDIAVVARGADQTTLATFEQTIVAARGCSAMAIALVGAGGAIDAGDDLAGSMDLAGADFVIAPAACGTTGDACTTDAECCSRLCDPTQHCASALWSCAPPGAACKSPMDCCNLHCNTSSVCDASGCAGDAQSCNVDRDCCSGSCVGGTCQTLNSTCKTSGNSCAGASDCCSGVCNGNNCTARGSFCVQNGDLCYGNVDCCSGECSLAPGRSAGTCTAAGLMACGIAGSLCSSCNGCCTGVCAPFGPLGVNICTPTTGCHAIGDTCVTAADCCGASGSGLPGDGGGHCTAVSGSSLGYCTVTGCDPEGGTCHVAAAACNPSARNDCCAPVGSAGMCMTDAFGTSRCHSITTCQGSGQTCTLDADCCAPLPCVADSTGTLRCAASSSCVSSGTACSATSQCCRGLSCVMASGTIRGTCRALGTSCALYGQTCAVKADCCNNVNCTNQRCVM